MPGAPGCVGCGGWVRLGWMWWGSQHTDRNILSSGLRVLPTTTGQGQDGLEPQGPSTGRTSREQGPPECGRPPNQNPETGPQGRPPEYRQLQGKGKSEGPAGQDLEGQEPLTSQAGRGITGTPGARVRKPPRISKPQGPRESQKQPSRPALREPKTVGQGQHRKPHQNQRPPGQEGTSTL